MLENLKKWLGGGSAPKSDHASLIDWAAQRQFACRAVSKEDGVVIDGRLGALPWRLEWGPSQRPYVTGRELRLRAEPGLPPTLQLLVINRELSVSLEKAVFDEYVEGVQTRIDTATPPEMRWLVMFPKLSGSELGVLRERYVAVSGSKPWLQRWLDGALGTALLAAPGTPADPLVLMIGRGRLMLRTACAEPTVEAIQAWLRVFESALREARRVQEEFGGNDAPSTQPSLWSASAMPGDPPPPP
jgi:hypothetical protein